MNIQKKRKLINLILFITTMYSTACNNQIQERRINSIFTGIEVLPGFVHSAESEYKLNDKLYSLRDIVEYDPNGNIIKLTIYKPEGILEYNKGDLTKDSALLNRVNFPTTQHLKYVLKQGLIDGNKKMAVEVINDSILVSNEGYLKIFYKLN